MPALLRSAAFALCLAVTAPALAQDIDCDDATTQFEMNICAHQSYLHADEALNQAYAQAMAAAKSRDEYLSDGDVPAELLLRDAQRAWIAFRDKACELESTIVRGGSMQPLVYSGCLERETRNRTEALEYFGELY